MIKLLKKTFFLTAIICLFNSCWSQVSEISNDITGTYSFQFPRGDYMLLKISKDSSFVQELYKDLENFKNKTPPFYVNKGTWSIHESHELWFKNWLEYCYLGNPDIIQKKPKKITMANVYWSRATKNNKAYISVFYDNGYVFIKKDSIGNGVN